MSEKIQNNIFFNPLDYALALDEPRHTTDVSSWHEHIPFAFTIVQMLQPKIFVELGTHNGDSYCAFCQAVEMLNTGTVCYAVDTWEGDEHSGRYNSSIFEKLRMHHDSLYGSFSTLIKSTFDKALGLFKDQSIDLLHIDGCHTYDAVKHDFDTWLPKMSERGVILLHDTNVREKDFGVWKLWAELAELYPNFELRHGHGLGILAVGKDVPQDFSVFLGYCANHEIEVRKYFKVLGQRISLLHQNTILIRNKGNMMDAAIRDKDTHIGNLEAWIKDKDTYIGNLEALIKDKDTHITNLEAILKDKDVHISNFETHIKNVESYMKGLQTHIDNVEAHARNLETHTKNLETAIKDKDVHIKNLEMHIMNVETHVRNLEAAIRDKDTHIQDIESLLKEKETTLNNIYRSRGWKVLHTYYKLKGSILHLIRGSK